MLFFSHHDTAKLMEQLFISLFFLLKCQSVPGKACSPMQQLEIKVPEGFFSSTFLFVFAFNFYISDSS